MSKFIKKKLANSLRLGSQAEPVAVSATSAIAKGAHGDVDVQSHDEFQDTDTALLHPDAHEEGGLGCANKEVFESQRGVISDLVKQMAKKLLAGNLNLINVSLPVKIFEPRSYLEKLCDVWTHSNYLQQAANTSDPVERLKLVITFFIAGIHLAFATWRKPFNPILGETWQAELPDGAAIYMEQASHHPPVSAFQMVGPQGAYIFSGLSQPEVSAKLQSNAIKTTAKGYRCVSFKDGGAVQIVYPTYQLKGILSGRPRAELLGHAEFIDKQHKLVASVVFGEIAGADDPLLRRSDAFSVTIRKQSAPTTDDAMPSGLLSSKLWHKPSIGKNLDTTKGSGGLQTATSAELVIAMGKGNWLGFLEFEGERYWTLCETQAPKWKAVASPLPSDVRHREDLQELQAGHVQRAQEAKEWLENRQRRDKKMREEGGWHGH